MSTIQTLDTGDNGSDSKDKLNTNLANLNTDKLEDSDLDGATPKATPIDADKITGINSVGSVLTYFTWANIKATLKTYFDTLYSTISHTQTASTITDFDTEVSNNSSVVANTAKNSYPSADSTKLAGIEASAKDDQTGAEIKALYEAESDTNEFSDAEQTKLAGVEASADVTDAGNVGSSINGATAKTTPVDTDTIAGINSVGTVLTRFTWANIKATLKTYFDTLYSLTGHSHTESDISDLDHDAVKIQGVTVDDTDKANGKILKYNSTSGNLEYEDDNEGAGGGDADAIHDNVAGEINAVTEKASPVSADLIIIEDSADSNNKKKVQIGNLPGGSGTDSDAIHDNVSAEISAITEKTTPVDADVALIEDSASTNAKKKLSWANIKATLKTYFDTLYASTLGADDNYVTDAEKTIIGNTSGANTGDDPGLENILEDTSPQLGGNLDVNGKDIVSVSNGDINIAPNGTGVLSVDSAIKSAGADGIDINPGSEISADLITVGVSGAPRFYWSESGQRFMFSTAIESSDDISANGSVYVNDYLYLDNDIRDKSTARELIKFSGVSSAVNEIGIKNNITANAPEVQATGDDTNIDLQLVPKGTGIVKGELHTMQVVLEASDTDLATGIKIQGDFRVPGNRAITIKAVGAYVDTAGVTGLLTVDINEAGTSILSTKITIDSGEKTSTTAVTAPVISDSAISADAIITFDIDGISSGTAQKGLKCWIEYVYA